MYMYMYMYIYIYIYIYVHGGFPDNYFGNEAGAEN